MALLTHLRENGVHLDIFALLNISDLSRARTISALHELYQRLAQEAPIPWHMTSPVARGLPSIDPGSGLARYIGVIDTLSSSQPPSEMYSRRPSEQSYRPVYTPRSPPGTSPPGRVFTGSISSSPPDMTAATYRAPVEPPIQRERRASAFSSIGSIGSISSWLRDRRRSSVESGEQDDPDRMDIAAAHSLPASPPSHTELITGTSPRRIPHPVHAELESPIVNDVDNNNPWLSVIQERVEHEMKEHALTHTNENLNAPRTSVASFPSINSDISNSSGSSNPSEIILLPHNPSIALWPPSKNNDYAGFCKGAWKQNSGFEGFKVHNQPAGYYSHVTKWKCVNCFFDMPVALTSDTRSRDYRFDEKVYTHAPSKIRYRWSFLAKSHIASKVRPTAASSSSPSAPKIGTFGCMFCCFEDDKSVLAFGGLDVFMNHLGAVHRDFAATLLGSTRCVMGRVAGVEEVFDINIPA